MNFTVLLLSISLGAIALPGSANDINSLKGNNTNIQVSTKHSILLAQSGVDQSTTSILYVNPSEGSDSENGSDRTPFKTIARALKVAQSGTTVFLAPGTYSTATGETFPLELKAGVTLQGDPATRGQDILIQGGGASTRKTLAQSLTIEITAPATLNGVTVTNPDSQGYGVGVDSSNSLIANSTFIENGYGLVIVGNSSVRIKNNYFSQNRTAGIGVAGIAQPTIQDNIFEQNGSAVTGGDRAAPLIANNRMTQNQNGMVFQGSAQPMVRNNSVEGNRQYGLIAKDTARPDLGTTTSLGGNFFRNNGLSDVDVSATDQAISAVGNEWLNAVGTLNTTKTALLMSATSTSAAAFPVPSTLSSNPAAEPHRPMRIVQIAMLSAPYNQTPPLQSTRSSQVTTPVQPVLRPLSVAPVSDNFSPLLSPPTAKPLAINIPSQPSAKVQNLPAIAPSSVASQTITAPSLETFPLPPSFSTQSIRPNTFVKPSTRKLVQSYPLLLPSSTAAMPIAIAVPPPETPIAAMPIAIAVPPPETVTLRPDMGIKSNRLMIEPPKAAKKTSTILLPVPSPNIPLGRVGGMPSVYSMRGAVEPSLGQNTTFFINAPKISNVRFRVVVNARQATEQAQVLSLVPDAFLIPSTNSVLMQVGAFSDRTKAEQLTRILADQGISSTIESVNP